MLDARFAQMDAKWDARFEKLDVKIDRVDAKVESKLEAFSTRRFSFWLTLISAAATIGAVILERS